MPIKKTKRGTERGWMAISKNRLSGTSKYDLPNQQFSRWTVEEDSCGWDPKQWPGR